jgi:HTH-type transcriptional regulator / antitoxin HipB
MKLSDTIFPALASQLMAERKRQGLSRTQAAAVCNVSTSFIRDAESDPGRCSLAKLLRLVNGLGLSMDVSGWNIADETPSSLKTS